MTNTKLNPPSLYNSLQYCFSHAALQTGGRTLHLAGQTALDINAELIGAGDLGLQAKHALMNLKTMLTEAGGKPEHIVRMRTYVVNHTIDKLGIVMPELAAFYDGATPAPNTWIGVQSLALPDYMIEFEATAVLPD